MADELGLKIKPNTSVGRVKHHTTLSPTSDTETRTVDDLPIPADFNGGN